MNNIYKSRTGARMRPIAIITAVVLLGIFPSLTASQSRSPLRSSEQPYRQPTNVLRHPGSSREYYTRQSSASQPAPIYQPDTAYEPPPSREPAPRYLVVPSSHAAPTVITNRGQPQSIHAPSSNATTSGISPTNHEAAKNHLKTPKKNRWADRELGASRKGKNKKQSYDGRGGLPSLVTIGSSLALVIGLFLIVSFLMRRATPAANAALPDEVVEVLGRAPLANRQHVHLLRCGNKMLLVCVTPNGTETITEITDAAEVDRLAALCRRNNNGSATANFRQVFQQFSWANDPSEPTGGRA